MANSNNQMKIMLDKQTSLRNKQNTNTISYDKCVAGECYDEACDFHALPFQSLTDIEFEHLTSYLNSNITQRDMDKLNQLKLNPFQSLNNLEDQNNIEDGNTSNFDDIPCNYHLPLEAKDLISESQTNEDFSILHLNIRSISNKFDSLKDLIISLNKDFSIIGLSENWLNDANNDQFEIKNYTHIHSHRSQKRGGGISLYITDQFDFQIRTDLTSTNEDVTELIFIEIKQKSMKNIIVGIIYRPPGNKLEEFNKTLDIILSKIDKENKLCYIMGDFNVDLLKSETCKYANQFIEQLFTSSL